MSNADKIKEFMAKHGVAKDEVWLVPGGKSYAIKHAALERIAFQNSITFSQPTIIEANGADGVVAMCVTGKLGDFSEWSIGEASPRNNKNAYPWAMAEKRAKDRVILKLLNIHGVLYSDAELDEARPATTVTLLQTDLPKSASQMTPAEIAAAVQERDPSEIEAAKALRAMIESAPSVKALDALMNSADWKATLEVANEADKPPLRKAYAERRETLSYKEAS